MRQRLTRLPLFLLAATLLVPLGLGGCPPVNNGDTGGDNTTGLAFDRVVVDSAAFGNPTAVMATDFDGDSRMDLVSVWKTLGYVRLHLQQRTNGAITWNNVTLASGSFAAGAQAVAVADLDQDGRPDILVGTSQGRILYLRQTGADSATPANWAASAIAAAEGLGLDSWSGLQAVDIDGDGQLEVVATLDSPGGRLSIFDPPSKPLNGVGWTRVDVAVTARNGAAQVLAIDMDGDSDIDLLTIARNEGSDSVVWYANPGANVALTNAWTRHAIGHVANARSIAFSYINADAFLDLVVSSGDGKQLFWFQAPQNVDDLLDTTKRWAQGTIASFGDDKGSGVISADIDKDNVFEIIAGTSGTGKLSLYKYDSLTQAWVETPIDTTPGNYGRTLIADVDGDGKYDLLTTLDAATSQIVWYHQK